MSKRTVLILIVFISLSTLLLVVGFKNPDYYQKGKDILNRKTEIKAQEELLTTSKLREPISLDTHTVKENESLESISERYQISVKSIVQVNSLEDGNIQVGQVLKVPPIDGVLVTVGEDDNLTTLANQYGTTEQIIVDYNWLDYPFTLHIGDTIFIPTTNF
jgi:hypothetical protein